MMIGTTDMDATFIHGMLMLCYTNPNKVFELAMKQAENDTEVALEIAANTCGMSLLAAKRNGVGVIILDSSKDKEM